LCTSELRAIRAFGLHNPVAVIPNGVHILDGVVGDATDPTPRAWDGRRIVLFLSRVNPKKGLLNLVDAWGKAGAYRAGWVLALAGPDERGHQAQVQERIDGLRLGESVRFIGPKYGEAKDAWLRRADAFVLPSFSEGFPMAALEAMSYGLPAILTPQCNFPEAQACGAALSVEPNVDAIAEGLKSLSGLSDAQRRDMGRKGRELVARNYTWPGVAEQMLDVYSWLMNGGPRPECVVMK